MPGSSAAHFDLIFYLIYIFYIHFKDPLMAHFNFLLYLKDPRQSGTFLWLAFGFRGISISCPRGPSLLLSNYFKHFLKSLIHPRKTKYFLHPIMSLTFRYPWVVPLLSSVSCSAKPQLRKYVFPVRPRRNQTQISFQTFILSPIRIGLRGNTCFSFHHHSS